MATLITKGTASSTKLSAKSLAIAGNVRVQALSSTLVRIELRGKNGFEDRPSFMVPQRSRPIAAVTVKREASATVFRFPNFQVEVPKGLKRSLEGVKVLSLDGRVLFAVEKRLPPQSFLPSPASKIEAYAVADSPRLIPPSWGATPPPKGNDMYPETSGWDTESDAPDLYVFVPGDGGYERLRADFLRLTGSIPIPPLWSFGYWDSQWYPYTEEEALGFIDAYRRRNFPLDVFVVDTDWRVNGSHGYDIASEYFPNMRRFIQAAHDRGVRLVYNDHPEPCTPSALDPKEFAFRWKGLTSMLRMGLDAWWFDRNWHTKLHEPMPGLAKEVWGQAMFRDITLRMRPKARPMVMSNVDGIDNGNRNRPPHPASHRYPIMWTGDTFAEWRYLQMGIANGVDLGVNALHPYINEDLGGHHSQPTNELYVRFLQFGAFSPTMRVHCTRHQERRPWIFGTEAETISLDYVKLRYRLLPTIYSAARRAYEDGTPILRRCDLEWKLPEATDNQQFLFGDDLLVAPVNESRHGTPRVIGREFLRTKDGLPGLKGEYFPNANLAGEPAVVRVDPEVEFNWQEGPVDPDLIGASFSARWSGCIGPAPETGEYLISITGDDGIRMRINDELVVDQWIVRTVGEDQVLLHLKQGDSAKIEIEFARFGGPASARLAWSLPSQTKDLAERSLWIPPGSWTDLWTGETIQGPQSRVERCPLHKMPLYARRGGIILMTDVKQTAGPMPWNPLVVEAFVPEDDGIVERRLYEDDGESNDYLRRIGRSTAVRMKREGDAVSIEAAPEGGSFAAGCSREVIVRLHLPKGQRAEYAGPHTTIEPDLANQGMPLAGRGSSPRGHEGQLVEVPLGSRSVDEAFRLDFRIR